MPPPTLPPTLLLLLQLASFIGASFAPVFPSPSCLMGDGVNGLTCPTPALGLNTSWPVDWSLRASTHPDAVLLCAFQRVLVDPLHVLFIVCVKLLM